MRQNTKKISVKTAIVFFCAVVLSSSISVTTSAIDIQGTECAGQFYEFSGNSHYQQDDLEKSADVTDHNTYGKFCIIGDAVQEGEKSGIPAYHINESEISFAYYYDAREKFDEDNWHLVEDKSKKFGDKKLSDKILSGVILLQTSRDGKNWTDAVTICDALSDENGVQTIYTATEVELLNGCYYRVAAAYKQEIRIKEGSFLGFSTDKHGHKKCAEVYEFYIKPRDEGADTIGPDRTYSLGSKVRAEQFDGYAGEKQINSKDPHYGWDLGNFFVSGYTDDTLNADGDVVFLKNVGNKVTLWFNLEQDIDCLNGNKGLSITADEEGHDQYFETPEMDLGRGTLLIRHTDHNNIKAAPEIYTNYLESNTVVGSDTKVQLFEEGDYEVALDYEVTSDKLINKTGHYRIFFKFSVRNGNCMAYPIDVGSGSELTNSSMTETGFKLDLAKSRYLKVNVKREVMRESADGLIEDTRFNGPAKDGAEYTDEGIYTVTVSNEYTHQFTTKRIYVGDNPVMRAYMTTNLSIPEINSLVAEGAVIADDGSIRQDEHQVKPNEEEQRDEEPEERPQENTMQKKGVSSVAIASILAISAVVILIVVKHVHDKKRYEAEECKKGEGGQ